MNKLATSLVLTLAFLAMPFNVFGQEADELCVETQVYGGGVGVVCGVKTHEPVDTGIEDVLPFLAGGLLAASYGFARFSKKAGQVS